MRRNILGSTVFQQVLLASARFTIAALILLWAITGVGLWQILSAQDTRIDEGRAWLEGLYYTDGNDAIIDALSNDDGAIWSQDDMFYFLEEAELMVAFRDPDYELLGGYEGLHGEDTLGPAVFDHPEIEEPVRGLFVQLRGGESIVVAEFVPQGFGDFQSFAWFGSFALVLIVLPLSVLTGYFLSRRVYDRIEGLSNTAASVASGQMASRVALSDRDDEFDRLGAGINAMLDEVAGLNENIEAVSVGVAHDLRTPLSNLGGRLELIGRDIEDPDAVAAHLDKAESHLSQVLRIFDAILRLGEVEAGKRRAAFGPVDLSGLVRDLGEAYGPVFEEADKSLTMALDTPIEVEGDRELLEQMLSNLLENALEHSRDAASVRLMLARTGQGITLTVADDGPGISPADRERVFERFFRADSSRLSPGNGLGLALVRAIADLHDADLALAEDTPGAEFVVRFPA